jgi:HSP20 family molecular chaperone IbpA
MAFWAFIEADSRSSKVFNILFKPFGRKGLARGPLGAHFLDKGRQNGARNQPSLSNQGRVMSKMTLGAHPYMLGFEQLERLLERSAKTGNDGYPPFNIEQTSAQSYRITLAVAGFGEEDLSITLEDSQLVIRGKQSDEDEGRHFLHRGIAARQFQRSFVLADGVEVGEARMENGLLHVDLTRVEPEKVVQTIRINRG